MQRKKRKDQLLNIQTYPKVELHLHLDRSLSYQVVHAIDSSVTEEQYRREYVAPAKCTSLVEVLAHAPTSFALMQTAEHLHMVVDDLFEQLQRDNVIYAEIRFAPLLHIEQGLTPEEVVSAVEEATTQASARTGIEAGVLLCTLRHFTAEESMQTARLVEHFKGTSVVGLDIAGDEAGYPLDAHIDAFHYAKQQGIPCTAHAGEARGADSVWETLEKLHPLRIGHGVRSSEDPKLLAALREKRIHLEVCPTSNIQTNTYEHYHNHPIDRMYNEQISLSINTDTRMITPVTLNSEYQQLHRHFGWNKEHFLHCNLNALQAAFQPLKKKRELEQRLRDKFANCD
jgi:adenosine deaminase